MKFAGFLNVIKRSFGRGILPHQAAFTLLNPLRQFILSPTELVKRLELNEDSKVLELGPGPGYFSIKAAQKVPKGYLVLVDIQEEMLPKCQIKGLKGME